MIDVLREFIAELRFVGLRVSMTETIDAIEAAHHFPLDDRDALREALASTLVKEHTHRAMYDSLFDVFFALERRDLTHDDDDATAAAHRAPGTRLPSRSELAELLYHALADGDRELVRLRSRQAVAVFAGFRVGGAVGSLLYIYRTLKAIKIDDLRARLVGDGDGDGDGTHGVNTLDQRLREEEYDQRIDWVRQEVESEIRRLLVAAQGSAAVAERLRTTLPEDADFLAATAAERDAMRDAVQPLARKLAAQLAIRRHRKHGAPDIRRTIRRSLAYGGTPMDLVFRRAQPAKPELVVLADVSGSVMLFARFALHLLNALQAEFRRVRSFAFIDSIDEITNLFQESDGVLELARKVNEKADVFWLDGRSDYGHSLETFWSSWGSSINARTTVLILGDGRNNYHASRAWVLDEIRQRARSLMWLNPEPIEQWDTGDSLMSEYGSRCDHAFECRNLRQLRQAIGTIVE